MIGNSMNLLAGTPISVGHYQIKPWTLREINAFGEQNYEIFLYYILLTKDKLKGNESIDQNLLEKIDDYQAICGVLMDNHIDLNIVLEGLKVTFQREFGFDRDEGFYYRLLDQYIPFENNLLRDIQHTISLQNYISSSTEQSAFKPANKKAKELFDKLQKARKQMQERNKKDKDGLSLHDIISIVACYSDDVNLLTIWDYTVYQLYEAFIRLQLWDEYHIVQSLAPYLEEDARKDTKHWGVKVSPTIQGGN